MKRDLKAYLTYGIAVDDLTPREKRTWVFWLYVNFGLFTYYFIKDLRHTADHEDGNFRHDPDFNPYASEPDPTNPPIAHMLADEDRKDPFRHIGDTRGLGDTRPTPEQLAATPPLPDPDEDLEGIW